MLLTQQAHRYEAQLQGLLLTIFVKAPSESRCPLAQESIIKELTTQIKAKEPLMHSTSAAVLNLLTREAADEEKKMLEEDVARWKNVASEHKRTIEGLKAMNHESQQIRWCFHISRAVLSLTVFAFHRKRSSVRAES
jgi:hypothetical protein